MCGVDSRLAFWLPLVVCLKLFTWCALHGILVSIVVHFSVWIWYCVILMCPCCFKQKGHFRSLIWCIWKEKVKKDVLVCILNPNESAAVKWNSGFLLFHTSAVSNLVFLAALILITWLRIWILVQNQHEQLWLQEEPEDECSQTLPSVFSSHSPVSISCLFKNTLKHVHFLILKSYFLIWCLNWYNLM